MRRSLSYLILLSCVLLWCTLLLVPPFVASVDTPVSGYSNLFYNFFSHICHQYDVRSLHIFGNKLGVCSRCSAIYFGFLLAVLLYPTISAKMRLNSWLAWGLALIPMMIDVLLDIFQIHYSTLTSRLLTGFIFGSIASCILIPFILEGLTELFNKFTILRGIDHELET